MIFHSFPKVTAPSLIGRAGGESALLLFVLLLAACSKKHGPAYETTVVEKGNISTTVTATGTIEPVTSVEVGTQVSGIVAKIYVDYNSEVKAGQVIAELDRTNLLSTLESQRANLTSAQSAYAYQKANYERYKTLYDKGLISANDFEQARLSYVQDEQQVTTARQSVKRAETDLGYATITSPINGVVLDKAVEEGQTVAASFSTPTLFTIAQDLTDMRVIADIDEADIGEVKEGQRVSFTVDAFPNDTFQGQVTQVRQQATTESNVVTYEVVISAPNADLKLKPGLTANVTIYTVRSVSRPTRPSLLRTRPSRAPMPRRSCGSAKARPSRPSPWKSASATAPPRRSSAAYSPAPKSSPTWSSAMLQKRNPPRRTRTPSCPDPATTIKRSKRPTP